MEMRRCISYLIFVSQVFREACRSVPSVVFMPHISEWWETVSDTVKSTFLTLLQDVPSFTPVLILATAETPYSQLSDEVRSFVFTQAHLHPIFT